MGFQHEEDALPLTLAEREALAEAQSLLGRVPEWYWRNKETVEEMRRTQREEDARFALLFEALLNRMQHAARYSGVRPAAGEYDADKSPQ